MGAGERVLLAGADVAEAARGAGDRFVAMAAEELGTRHGGGDPPAHRRVGVLGARRGTVDVDERLVEAAQRRGGVRPQQEQRRFAVGHRPETGEDAEHRSRLDRLRHRLGQVRQHARRPIGDPGVEEQADRLEGMVTLGESGSEPRRRRRLDVVGTVEGGVEDVDVARHLAAQRDPSLQRSRHEAGAAERGEQALVDAGRAGEQADEDAIGGVEGVEGGGVGARATGGRRRRRGPVPAVAATGRVR